MTQTVPVTWKPTSRDVNYLCMTCRGAVKLANAQAALRHARSNYGHVIEVEAHTVTTLRVTAKALAASNA